MYRGQDSYELIDCEIGRLIRLLSFVEVSALFVAAAARADKTWVELNLMKPSEIVALIQAEAHRFPSDDHRLLGEYLEDAVEVLEIRNMIVHGRWSLLDADSDLYEVEKVLTKSAARRALNRSNWTDEEHPARVMPMNAATVARAHRMASHVGEYFDDNCSRWERHFGVRGS